MLTWIEINKNNILHNIRQFKSLAPHSELWPVVKSNAYGHGLEEIVRYLSNNEDISGFMVVNLDEAIQIKDLTSKPIIVLSYFDLEGKEALENLDSRISLPVYTLETIEQLSKLNNKFSLNVKIDTGTSRLGFTKAEFSQAIEKIKNIDSLSIYSIFTHYAESEAEDKTFTRKQLQEFQEVTKDFKEYKLHSACSAASISLPESQADIIRVGLSFYGLWPSQATKKIANINLLPIMTWKTKIIQVKNLKKGDTIGYNRTYQCTSDCQIAVLPVGYNEGYDRSLSNKSEVLINGIRCKIRGNICMNLSMIEIPNGLDVKVGDVVTLLGEDNKENISVEELADKCQTINYEIVTRINSNIKRIIL